MHVIADLQLHSRFSRAVSSHMTIPNIAVWAKRKGIGLVATGDWTHPIWFREIERELEEMGNGLLKLKHQTVEEGSEEVGMGGERLKGDNTQQPSTLQRQPSPLFLLATEVSCI